MRRRQRNEFAIGTGRQNGEPFGHLRRQPEPDQLVQHPCLTTDQSALLGLDCGILQELNGLAIGTLGRSDRRPCGRQAWGEQIDTAGLGVGCSHERLRGAHVAEQCAGHREAGQCQDDRSSEPTLVRLGQRPLEVVSSFAHAPERHAALCCDETAPDGRDEHIVVHGVLVAVLSVLQRFDEPSGLLQPHGHVRKVCARMHRQRWLIGAHRNRVRLLGTCNAVACASNQGEHDRANHGELADRIFATRMQQIKQRYRGGAVARPGKNRCP